MRASARELRTESRVGCRRRLVSFSLHFVASVMWTLLIWMFALTAAEENDCPDKLPIFKDGFCFALQAELQRSNDAEGSCDRLSSGAHLAQLPSMDVVDEIVDFIKDFIQSKLEKAYFWVGLRRLVEPPGPPGSNKEKKWEWNYDESEIKEDDYTMWIEKPSGGLACAVLNGSYNFDVQAVDCGGPRLPCLCMRSTTSPCTETGLPYLMYEDICAGVVNGALEYRYALGACLKGNLAPYKDGETKRKLLMAVYNSFLGGGIYVGLRKGDDGKFFFADFSEPESDWWEPGEPRDEGDCVGLSVQEDWSLRLKTMECGMMAFSLCSFQDPNLPDDNKKLHGNNEEIE